MRYAVRIPSTPPGLGTAYSGPITEVLQDGQAPGGVDAGTGIIPQAGLPTHHTPVDSALALAESSVSGLNPFLIPDGFAYNVHLKYLPFRMYPMQVRLLDDYRRQSLLGLWQPRWYPVPPDASVAIAGGDTLNYELHVARGSVLWGYSFAVVSPATVAQFRVTLRDLCNNANIISQFEIASGLRANFTTGTPSSGFTCVLLPEPYAISGTGDLQTNIVNTSASSGQCQLLLMMLEPTGSPQ